MMTLKGTPFHERAAARCQSHEWQRWSGYLTAASYDLHHEWEYHAIRGAAGLIDISPLRKYRVTGPDAEAFLNRVVTRDVSRCRVGQVLYTPWCDGEGKVIDDGTLQRFGPQSFRLTSADHNLHWLHQNAFGYNVTIEDESDAVAALALQGPQSRAVLQRAAKCEIPLEDLRFFRMTKAEIAGRPLHISRTGFTGDLGYEIWMDPQDALPVWDCLMDAGEDYLITPAGMHAIGLARIEAGLVLINVDYISSHHALIESQKSSPFEIGLGWTVSLKKGPFVGRQALLAEKARPPQWQFAGLEIDWPSIEACFEAYGLAPRIPALARRESLPLYDLGKQVGYATSSCYSPILKKYIALATVESGYGAVGKTLEIQLTIEHRQTLIPCRVVKLPFFDPERKRN